MGKKKSLSPKKKRAATQRRELPLERLRTETDFLKYIRLLKLFAKKYCVMIVASDTPVGPAATWEMTGALMALGLQIDLYGKFRCAYAAMIDAGQVVFEELKSDTRETISQEIIVRNKKVKLVSAGFNAGHPQGSILIDGKNYSQNKRGLNIVVYDKITGKVLDRTAFDLYINTFPRFSPYLDMLELKEFERTHPNVLLICTRFPAFPENPITPGERFIQERNLSYHVILRNLHQHIFTLNSYFDEAGIAEVLSVPKSYFDLNGVRHFEDIHSKHINISGGHRETGYQPEKFQRTIFLVGGCAVFGIGADDRRTVASYLQAQCSRHKPDAGLIVQNYGYFLAGDDIKGGEYFKILNNLPVKPGDIVICLLSLEYSEDFLWIDLSRAAEETRTCEMFFDKAHYTPDGYRLIAEGLFKGLMELGVLLSAENPERRPRLNQSSSVLDNLPGSDLRSTCDFAGYLRLLRKYAQKYCVLVSSWETSGLGFTDGLFELYREVGFQEDLIGKLDCAYAAVIDAGELVYEELCEDASQYIDVTLTDEDFNFEANIVSRGQHSPPFEKSPIEINGNSYSSKGRGLHFVVYDKIKRAAIDTVNFDVSLDAIPCYRHLNHGSDKVLPDGSTSMSAVNKTETGIPTAVYQPATEKEKRDFPFEADTYKELAEYKKALTDWYEQTLSFTIGSVVMNCNPFTLGHRFLIEEALKQCSFLIIFVVQEDKSRFPFEDRLRLVKDGVADLKNVAVLPSGKFVLSSLTFSEYFNKSELQDRTINTSLDVTVFAREIAPCLHITKRFAGEEPYDAVTRQYNETMRRILPEYGIEFVVIPRKTDTHGGEMAISASRVRELLEKRDFEAIKPLVPETTFQYLLNLPPDN